MLIVKIIAVYSYQNFNYIIYSNNFNINILNAKMRKYENSISPHVKTGLPEQKVRPEKYKKPEKRHFGKKNNIQ